MTKIIKFKYTDFKKQTIEYRIEDEDRNVLCNGLRATYQTEDPSKADTYMNPSIIPVIENICLKHAAQKERIIES